MKEKSFFIILSIHLLSACGSDTESTIQEQDPFSEPVTAIEVVELSSGEVLEVITDRTFIDQLTTELEEASFISTENIEYDPPEFSLVFFAEEIDPIFEMSYYPDPVTYDEVEGQYHTIEYEEHYAVVLDLPVTLLDE